MDFSELTNDLQHLTQAEFLYVGGAILALAFLLVLLVRGSLRTSSPTQLRMAA